VVRAPATVVGIWFTQPRRWAVGTCLCRTAPTGTLAGSVVHKRRLPTCHTAPPPGCCVGRYKEQETFCLPTVVADCSTPWWNGTGTVRLLRDRRRARLGGLVGVPSGVACRHQLHHTKLLRHPTTPRHPVARLPARRAPTNVAVYLPDHVHLPVWRLNNCSAI